MIACINNVQSTGKLPLHLARPKAQASKVRHIGLPGSRPDIAPSAAATDGKQLHVKFANTSFHPTIHFNPSK